MLEKYHNIIYETVNRIPNYREIQFDKFIEIFFERNNMFLYEIDINEIEIKIRNKYGNLNSCFKQFGEFKIEKIDNIKYYQKGVGIEGPKHSKLEDPVFVIKMGNDKILFNGYHRVLANILKNKKKIRVYELDIS